MPLRDDLLTPIPGDNASGENLRYAPVYDKIKEARREDDDAPQGEWQRERKAADFNLVIKLAGDALATKSKDLQLAAWLTEAVLRKDGFSGLRDGLELISGLLHGFWDTLYPEMEDGDLELRAAPLEWVGSFLEGPLRKAGITRSGLSFYKYKESRAVGYEEQAAESDTRRSARETAIAEGKITAEEFDAASANTPSELYGEWVETLDATLTDLDALNELCQEKFGEYTPSFSKLHTGLEEVRQVVNSIWQKKLDAEGRPAGREAAPVEDAPAEPEYTRQAVPLASGAAAAPARARRQLAGIQPADADEVAPRLAAIAGFLRHADADSPAPYLMLRGFRWGELRGSGDSPDGSFLVAPSTEVRHQLKRLFVDASYAELLEAAETAMAEPCGRAWLDLQRYVVRACEADGHAAIAAAVRSELKALLTDLPALTQWTLADDTPTANAETQAWLAEFVPKAETGSAGLVSQAYSMRGDEEERAGAAEPEAPDAFELAMAKVRSGRAQEAIEMLAQDIQLQSSGRGRFQRRLQLAQLCLASGHEALARPILEQLAEVIDSHHLDEWESADAIAHPLAMLYRCLDQAEPDAAVRGRLYARICRLDPVQALACGR